MLSRRDDALQAAARVLVEAAQAFLDEVRHELVRAQVRSSPPAQQLDQAEPSAAHEPVPREALIRIPEVRRLTGLSRTAIYKHMAAGTFPRPRRLGAQAVAWHAAEVLDWIASRPTAGFQKHPLSQTRGRGEKPLATVQHLRGAR